MKFTYFLFLFIVALATSCESKIDEVKIEIEIGEYTIQFPEGFKLMKEQGVDSYVGKISNGELEFHFDYGYYSDKLEKSVEEKVNEDVWKWNALGQNNRLPNGCDWSQKAKETKLVKYETLDSSQYTLTFVHKGDTLHYVMQIPEETRRAKVEIDTIDNVVFKLVNSMNYVGLYAKNLNSFNKSINSCKALSITAEYRNEDDRKKALDILRTCKLKK